MSNKNKPLSKFKPSSDDFEFRQFPFYWLMKLKNTYTLRMEKVLKRSKLNITIWRVCMILREHGTISITEIAKHAVAKLPTITKTVYKMQEAGLVNIYSGIEDARVSLVTITPKGLNTVSEVINDTSRIFEHAYEGLNEKQIHELNSTLQHLYNNLSEE